jgi:hypothetical protein
MITDNKIDPRSLVARMALRAGRLVDGLLTRPVITATGGDTAKFNVSAFSYRLGGNVYYVAASVSNVFSAVHATGIAAWIGIGLYIDARGTVTTLSNPNTGDQDAATEAAALASIPVALPGQNVRFGTIRLKTAAADWDANTDLLDAADLVSANLLGEYPDRRWSQFPLQGNVQLDSVHTFCRAKSAIGNVQVLMSHDGFNGPVTNPTIEVDRHTVANTTVIKLKVGAFDYLIDGVLYHKEPQDAIAFTAAHVVALNKWGAVLLQINAAGTIGSLVSGALQTTPQTYTNSAAARAALPAPTALSVVIGALVVEAGAAAWTANTDDIVAGSDLEDFQIVPELVDRALGDVTLAIDANAIKFKISAFDYSIGGVKYAKAAATAIVFSAAHVCALGKYLAILTSIDAAGTVTTRVPLIDGLSQTASQGFDSFDAALAALPNTLADKLGCGVIVVQGGVAAWTANTDDMVAGSDLAAVWFLGFKTNQKNGLKGRQPTNQNTLFPVSNATLVANLNTAGTFEAGTDPRSARGFAGGSLAIYLGDTTGLISAPEVIVAVRPFPLNGETFATAKAVG